MEKPKDKDYLENPDKLIFCVVGYLHPPDRYTAYLKYLPDPHGRWRRGVQRFGRALKYYHVTQVEATYKLLRERYPQYLYHCPVRGIRVSAVPRSHVRRYHRPGERLRALIDEGASDPLEEKLLSLVELLFEGSGLKPTDLGVTGSLLLEIHSPEFSDIDLTVYGLEASRRVREALKGGIEGVEAPSKGWLWDWCHRRVGKLSIGFEELMRIAERRWNQGFYEGTYFSLHPVRRDEEIREEYGERFYRRIGVVEGEAVIKDASEGLYTPAIYRVEDITLREEIRGVSEVEEVASFEGIFAGVFDEGERIGFRGILERVQEKGRAYHRVVIGAAASDGGYIRTL
jgi:hypothetical protein